MKRILSLIILLAICLSLSAQGHFRYRSKRLSKEPVKLKSEQLIKERLERKVPVQLATKAGSTSEIKGLVLLVEFPDKGFVTSNIQTNVNNLLNQIGYTGGGNTASAKEYFEDQFLGEVTFNFDVIKVPVLSHDRGYYGQNGDDGEIDIHVPDMVKEACQAVDAQVDFSKYAIDGEVPMVFVFFAGEDETFYYGSSQEQPDLIWPHSYVINGSRGITLDGVMVNNYACTSEVEPVQTGKSTYTFVLAPIGTFCHEFSHTLGLLDLYDTDYEGSGGYSAGCWGTLAIMDAGNYCNDGKTPPPYNSVDYFMINALLDDPIAEIKGLNIEELQVGKNYVLAPFSRTNKNLYYISNGSDTEFYLFEVHSSSNRWDAHIGGTGLLVYHIDLSKNSAGYSETYMKNMTAIERWEYNEINCRPTYQCCDLIEADSRKDAVEVYLGDADAGLFFPYRTKTSLSPGTTPAMKFRTGTQPKVALTNISVQSNGNVAFSVVKYEGGEGPSSVIPQVSSAGIQTNVFQNLAVISFSSDIATDLTPVVAYNEVSPGASKVQAEAVKDADGKYYCRLENINPRTTYNVVVYFVQDGIEGVKKSTSFLTKTKSTYGPYIDFSGCDRNEDGSFKKGAQLYLAVNNCPQAKSIEYFFDEAPVEFSRGYMLLEHSGDLKIKIKYKDDTETVLYKYLRVK
ncbi:MAG: M6 family metalloprotease domain-containing protein [Bacteroidales bacterium]|nr:M6 family metalloprotease domain-containing protein [Bacteroidales bacterium]